MRNAGTGDNDTLKCSGNTDWQQAVLFMNSRVIIQNNFFLIIQACGFFWKNLSKIAIFYRPRSSFIYFSSTLVFPSGKTLGLRFFYSIRG